MVNYHHFISMDNYDRQYKGDYAEELAIYRAPVTGGQQFGLDTGTQNRSLYAFVSKLQQYTGL